jgi:hypothetical protein
MDLLDLQDVEVLAVKPGGAAQEHPDVCPYGRPIVKRVRLAELLREFGRL